MAPSVIHWIHLLLFGPLLLLIGLGFVDDISWLPRPSIAILGALILLYHASRIYAKYRTGQPSWTNFVHVLIVAPTLIGYGLTGERWIREVILLLAFAAIGYHGYYAIKKY